MMSSVFLRGFQGTAFGGRVDASPSAAGKAKPHRAARRSRLGRAFLLQMLMSGTAVNSTSTRRHDVATQSAIVEEQPSVRNPLLNGVQDDWSGEPSSQDWDGREIEGSSQGLTAIAGLLAVAGAGYFCTRAVGALFNHRSDLARIVPHPVAFSRSSSTGDVSSPRSSFSDDSRLRSRPLSPDSLGIVRTHDRGTSPIPQDKGINRTTSMGSLAQVDSVTNAGQRIDDVEDDVASMTSAADAIEVASTASSMESSDLGSLDMKDLIMRNRGLYSELPHSRSMSPDLIQKLPQEYTVGTLRERAQLAMKAANAATEAAQRASAFSAAASTASATASKASSQAMAAAALAHIALESGDVEKMTNAQAEAWKAVQIAAEAERRSAEAAALATAYEDLAEQQAKVARELSRPPVGFFRSISRNVSDFFYPINAAIVGMTSSIAQWFVGMCTYFSSGMCWHQFCSFCGQSVSFIHGILVSLFHGIKDAILYVFQKIAGFCSYAGNSISSGWDSCMRFFRVLCTRILHPKGPIGGDATA